MAVPAAAARPKTTEELVGEFGNILDALMAPQEGPRQGAEKYLRTLSVAQPGEIMLVLALIGAQGVGGFQLDHRFLSLILLKRLAFRALPGLFLNERAQHASAPFDVVKETMRSRIETILCSGLKDEMNTRMRKGLGTCVAAWAEESAIRHRPVLPLPPVLIELTQDKNAFHRFTPYQVIAIFPTLLVDSVHEPLPAVQVAAMLMGGLHDPSVDVRVEAIKAVEAVITGSFTGKERSRVGPEMAEACFTALCNLPAEALSHALTPLVDLAWDYHSLLSAPGAIGRILDIILPMLAPPNHESTGVQWSSFAPPPADVDYDDWTQYANLAQEVVLAIAYFFPAESQAWHGGRMVEELLGMMVGRKVAQFAWEGEEQTDWIKEESVEVGEWPAPEPADTISRLTFSHAHPNLENIMFGKLKACMESEDWRVVCAGLECFTPIVPNASLQAEVHMQPFFDLTEKCVNHEHFRVRYAFLACIDDMCHAVRAPFAITSQVLKLCLERLHDPVERVRAQAINSLADVLRLMTDEEVKEMDMKHIADALCDAYARSGNFVKDRVLVAMGEVESYFLHQPDYVGAWSDFLLDIIKTGNSPDMRTVVVRAIECVTLPVFLRALCAMPSQQLKVSHIMHAILLHQNDCTTADDPRARCIVDAMATLAKVTGSAFTPMVPVTVPFIFRLANASTGATANGAQSLTQDDPEDELEFDEYGDLPFDNDRSAALMALGTIAMQVPGRMGPYVKQGMILALEGTRSMSSSMVNAASYLVAAMLSVAKQNGAEIDVESLLAALLDRLRRSDRGAGTQWSHVHVLYKAFTDCVRIIAMPLPDQILLALYHSVQAHLAIAGRRLQLHKSDGVDTEDFDDDDDYDDDDYVGGRAAQIKRTMEMIKDALHAVAEVAGMLKRPKRKTGDDADPDPATNEGVNTVEAVHVSAHRTADVELSDLFTVDAARLGTGNEVVRDQWNSILGRIGDVQGVY